MNRLNVPENYGVCLCEPTVCPLSAHCLRSLAWQQTKASRENYTFLQVVNPKCAVTNYATSDCLEFRTDEPKRFARGMTHLYDQVAKGQYASVREQVKACFSCERVYYYAKNGTQLIPPDVQEAIACVFKRNHIAQPPQFDDFVYEYDWR